VQGLIGQTLGGYRILSQIGKGGMATVFKAYQPSLDRYVAIKVLPPYYAEQDETFLKRFRQEATAIASLRHPNILIVLDYGELEHTTYLVMEFVEAGTLASLMGRPLAPAVMAQLLGQVAGALQYAHEQGVVHRDIKPSNILLPKPDWPLLTDFGLAKIVGGTQLTQSGTVAGTPAYMSPEQGRGERVDARSDIYSLGIVLYEMATGVVPFEAETPMAVIVKHIVDPLPLPSSKNPQLAEGIERVILRALAKNPDDRFGSVAQMSEALAAAVAELPPAQAAEVPRPPARDLTTIQVAESLDREGAVAGPAPPGEAGTGRGEPWATGVQAAGEAAVAMTGVESGAVGQGVPSHGGRRRRSRWLLFGLGAGVVVLGLVGFAAIRVLSSAGAPEPQAGSAATDAPRVEEPVSEASDLRTLDQLVADGQASLQAGDVKGALRDFEVALERDPENPDRYFDLARSYAAAGDWDTASALIQQAVGLSPDDYSLNESAGWVYQELGLYESSAAAFKRALELNPQAFWLYPAAADSYLAAGLTDAAATVLLEGLANPEIGSDPDSLESIGWEFRDLGMLDQAGEAFSMAIDSGGTPGAWEGLAQLSYDQGDIPGGLSILAQASGVYPEHANFANMSGWWHWELGNVAPAEVAFRRAIELEPSNPSHYSALAGLLAEQGRAAEAEELLLGGLAAHPEELGFLWELGSFYVGQGRYDEAAAQYERILEFTPEDGWAYAELARVQFWLGNPDAARAHLEQAAALNSGDPWLADKIGWIYIDLGDCANALVQFQAALAVDPSIDSSAEGLRNCGG
jgi:tetratricopeptide (TPR) repeat protein/tRNA A-37 threonylcarbamoyl transferase component Bud32